MSIEFNQELDVKGAKCPMPLVKSRKAVNGIGVGEILKVVAQPGMARQATDLEARGVERVDPPDWHGRPDARQTLAERGEGVGGVLGHVAPDVLERFLKESALRDRCDQGRRV